MTEYNFPGVYIEEGVSTSRHVSELQTAVPAFVGYTEIAKDHKDEDLRLKPTKISSMQEYQRYFGGPQKDYEDVDGKRFAVDITIEGDGNISIMHVYEPELAYTLFYAMQMFFDNGGADCYVVSVAAYNALIPEVSLFGTVDNGLINGLETLKKQDDVTLLLIPEAVKLTETDYEKLIHEMLQQCNVLQDRFAIFDLYNGDRLLSQGQLSRSRDRFGKVYLKFGAAYYPYLKTGINYQLNEKAITVTLLNSSSRSSTATDKISLLRLKEKNALAYTAVIAALKKYFVVLPPSSAVAGVYVATDASKGVWKAPANVSLTNVIKPTVKIDNDLQAALNTDAVSGKSINAIRAFSWKETLIWGARTLASNDNEWRYVPVRRFCINLEESIKRSTHWTVFDANDAHTWSNVENMIETYLTQKRRQGALVGDSSRQAFFVRCGLGKTMNSVDLAEGRLNVELGVAIVRPAEFIVIKFTHYLQS